MKQILLLIIILLTLSGCSTKLNNDSEIIENLENNSQFEYENSQKINIVAFGDSLTEGLGVDRLDAYPAQLESELIKLGYNAKVFNSGYSGETSTGALNRVDWVLTLNPDIIILTIGANDAIRGIDLSITKSNIEKTINLLKDNNITIILSGMEIYDNLGETYANEFKNIYPQISQKYNLTFIPLFLDGVATNSSLNIQDEIHPNKQGYNIIVNKNILPKLLPILDKYY
jgi:acyl-CoA thioesterase-1